MLLSSSSSSSSSSDEEEDMLGVSPPTRRSRIGSSFHVPDDRRGACDSETQGIHEDGGGNRAWRQTLFDPRTGRHDFDDPSLSRESRWDRPTTQETTTHKTKEDNQHFFRMMEQNIRNKLEDRPWSCMVEISSTPKTDEPTRRSTMMMSSSSSSSSSSSRFFFRTLSSIDDMVLLHEYKKGAIQDVVLRPPHHPVVTMEDIQRMQREFDGVARMNTRSRPVVDIDDDLRRRANTTSTIFVRMGTMSAPDEEATIQCVCVVIRAHLLESMTNPCHSDKYPWFDSLSTMTEMTEKRSTNAVPSLSAMTTFMREVHTKAQMESECIIMSLIYVERLLKTTDGELQILPKNWKCILFCSMIMASKVWDDLSMWNADFSRIFPAFTLQRVNQLELSYLNAVQYNVRVSASSYAKYYFHLRAMGTSMGIRGGGGVADHPLPLDFQRARKIQGLSERLEQKARHPRERSTTLAGVSSKIMSDLEQKGYQLTNAVASRVCLEQLVSMDRSTSSTRARAHSRVSFHHQEYNF